MHDDVFRYPRSAKEGAVLGGGYTPIRISLILHPSALV